MKSIAVAPICLLCVFVAHVLAGCAATAAKPLEPKEVQILEQWQGDYPVAHLDRLPQDQQQSSVGFIGDAATFDSVWQVFKPDEKTPLVDFGRNFVVFARNVNYYNRTSIAKIILTDGTVEVLSMATLSALPIEAAAAMAMAVVPRAGISAIMAGSRRITVTTDE